MDESTTGRLGTQGTVGGVLEELAREGARRMLAEAMKREVEEFVERNAERVDEEGHRMAVRNGSMRERDILSGVGPIRVKQPRVDDTKLRASGEEGFRSAILPKYARRMPSLDALLPVLYLKGVSAAAMEGALASILGEGAAGVSATTVVRLKGQWEQEYQSWSHRDLSGKRYAYFWADGIHVNVRLDDEKSCILVIMAADLVGNKELVAVSDGYRESTESWREMLLDLKRRGLELGPKLAIADGALGFWGALREVYPEVREQRCWVHKTGNVLDKMAKSVQSKAKGMIHEMYMAPTKKQARAAYQHFIDSWGEKYPKAVECLAKDEEALFTFYDFPASHWAHIRTSNPIESTYATVRQRTRATKGCGSRTATLSMVFKLALEAQKTWRRIAGYELVGLVMAGTVFVDGELAVAA